MRREDDLHFFDFFKEIFWSNSGKNVAHYIKLNQIKLEKTDELDQVWEQRADQGPNPAR